MGADACWPPPDTGLGAGVGAWAPPIDGGLMLPGAPFGALTPGIAGTVRFTKAGAGRSYTGRGDNVLTGMTTCPPIVAETFFSRAGIAVAWLGGRLFTAISGYGPL